MDNPKVPANSGYDPRWFVWTIVFLVATGISLVSYIMLSDSGAYDVPSIQPAVHNNATSSAATK